MTDPQETRVASTWSPTPVTQAGRSGQDAKLTRAIRLEAVAYTVGACRVSEISVGLQPGQIAALTGPVGSGKSTLLRVVGGVHKLACGELWFGEREASSILPEQRDISWAPQGGGLLPALPVWKQIGFPLSARGIASSSEVRDRVQMAASEWDISDLLDHRPEHLSGGERQLVALARATIRRPAGLMLDEPYSALSDDRRLFAIERLRKWRANGPPLWIIHASHRVEEVVDASVVWRIVDGRLQAASVAG